MTFEFRLKPYTLGIGDTVTEIIKNHNHQKINPTVTRLLVDHLKEVNKDRLPLTIDTEIMVPILLPFYKE